MIGEKGAKFHEKICISDKRCKSSIVDKEALFDALKTRSIGPEI
jgi:hypothetical protein